MYFASSAGLALALFLLPVSVHAAENAPDFTVSGAATLISDYRFRGISLTGKDPAVQATVNLSHKSGIYVGTWTSSLDMGDRYGPTEVDFYSGWSGALAARTRLDVALAYYSYPGGEGSGKIEYFETTSRLTRDFGPFSATVGSGYSWSQAALGGDHLYLFGETAAPVPGTPLILRAHGGRSKGAISPRPGGYYDWSVGADAALGLITLGLSDGDTDLGTYNADAGALVARTGAL